MKILNQNQITEKLGLCKCKSKIWNSKRRFRKSCDKV